MQDGQQPNEPGWVFKPDSAAKDTAELPPLSGTPINQPASEVQSTPATQISQSAPQPVVVPQIPNQPATAAFSEGPGKVQWSASEYIANPKSAGWYVMLAIGSLLFAIVFYIVTKDMVPTVVIGLLGIIVGIFAARQPQTLQYAIDNNGLYIGNKYYPYDSFKAFSIARDQAIGFIQLLPLKRFMPPLVIHYAPEDEDKIADTLADYLPYEEHKDDLVDSLSRRLRF